MVREDPITQTPAPSSQEHEESQHRLNLLLCFARHWNDGNIDGLLPPLLKPLGVECLATESAADATEILRGRSVHIAIVDLAVPLNQRDRTEPGGPRVLQLLRRLDQPPPTVVVRPPQATHREQVRGLSDALREGAFAVLDRPVHWETMLETLRRLMRRHYSGLWPDRT